MCSWNWKCNIFGPHSAHPTVCRSASVRNNLCRIDTMFEDLSLSCSICDFIKHKGSFEAIMFLALNSPLITSDQSNRSLHVSSVQSSAINCAISTAGCATLNAFKSTDEGLTLLRVIRNKRSCAQLVTAEASCRQSFRVKSNIFHSKFIPQSLTPYVTLNSSSSGSCQQNHAIHLVFIPSTFLQFSPI